MMAEFNTRWNALPERTRHLILVGAVVIAALLLYSAVWLPLGRDLTRLRAAVPHETEQLAWMQAQTPMVKAMRAKMTSATTGALVPSIEQSATSHGVRTFITKLDAEGSSGARVTLEAAPFNNVVVWISDMQAAQGLVVEDATIEAHASSGLVNARLRLRTGGT